VYERTLITRSPASAPGVLSPARPQLAPALAVVTGWPVERVEAYLGTADGLDAMFGSIDGGNRTPAPAWLGGDVLIDPAEAWEALATHGVIPLGWVTDEGRRFVRRYNIATDRLPKPTPHPPSVRACVTLASDPQGVETAEHLARELGARPRLVVWMTSARTLDADRRESLQRLRDATSTPPAERDLLGLGYVMHDVTADAVVLLAPEP
jgi:hypothetical protein